MAVTSPDNIRTPDSGDQYALVQDLGVLADTTQAALTKRGNLFVGTAAQRTAFTTATNGMNWQDTDGTAARYVRVAGAWVMQGDRAYAGTGVLRTAFTTAPVGSMWRDTDGAQALYIRSGGAWVEDHPTVTYSLTSGALASNAWTVFSSAGSWTPSGSTFTWSNGVVIPRTGVYEISLSGRVPANLSIFFGLKVNNTAASITGVVAMNASVGFSLETAGSVSRLIPLNAGDVVTPAMYTPGASGPYGLNAPGTSFSVSHIR